MPEPTDQFKTTFIVSIHCATQSDEQMHALCGELTRWLQDKSEQMGIALPPKPVSFRPEWAVAIGGGEQHEIDPPLMGFSDVEEDIDEDEICDW